jgi:hypothetical protein
MSPAPLLEAATALLVTIRGGRRTPAGSLPHKRIQTPAGRSAVNIKLGRRALKSIVTLPPGESCYNGKAAYTVASSTVSGRQDDPMFKLPPYGLL